MSAKKIVRKTSTQPIVEDIPPMDVKPVFTKKYTLLLLAFVLLFVVAYLNKSWFVVAIVNGKLISRIALDKTMVKQFGTQTLENMISDTLVRDEIAKEKISISQSEIDQSISEISSGLPSGVTLEQALELQGMDMEEFKKQIEIQLAVNKILGSKVSVTDSEVQDYLATNSALFKDSSPSAAKESAREVLKRQKENQAFSSWFAEIKQNAKILKFL